MRIPKAINNLVEAFERLPGIGPKSAQRLTYYLLHVPQIQLDKFANSLTELKSNTVECGICHNIAERNPCDICSDTQRGTSTICVVEQPLDVLALEAGGSYKGLYHVLHGVIDPLHNIGPDEIKISELLKRLDNPLVQEVIFALNPNMEGEATCLYIKKQIEIQSKAAIKVSRLAHGLPTGADIQYADQSTLTRALNGRTEYN